MKKSTALLLAAVMLLSVFAFAACGKTAGTAEAPETGDTTVEPVDVTEFNAENTDASEAADAETTDAADPIDAADPTAFTGTADGKGIPAVAFSADKTEVRPGEDITVTFRLSDAEWIACFSTELEYDPLAFVLKDNETYSESGYYDMFNDEVGKILYYGYVLETFNVADEDMLSVTFTVSEDAKPGTQTSFRFSVPEMKLGTDKAGSGTYEVAENYSLFEVGVKIV